MAVNISNVHPVSGLPSQVLADVSRRHLTVPSAASWALFMLDHFISVIVILMSNHVELESRVQFVPLAELSSSYPILPGGRGRGWGPHFGQQIQFSSNVLTHYFILKSYKVLAVVEQLADD